MTNILGTCEVFISMGLVYSLIAMGYYITYTILDFPDLTVEGTFLTGAVAYGLLITAGVNAWLALIAAFAAGAIFGTLTGVLYVKLKIRPLLCGILVSTALISVNLVATSAGVSGDFAGKSASNINNLSRIETSLHNIFPADLLPARVGTVKLRDLILFLFVALVFKFLLDFFLTTKTGLLLRAAGNNPTFVTTLARDQGNMKILGLAIGNGYAAVSGALFTLISGSVNQSMGIGMVVIGLASLIIGLSVFAKVHFLKPTTKVIIGSIIYQLCLTVAQKLGVPDAYNKLIMAFIFTIALILSSKMKNRSKLEKSERNSVPAEAGSSGGNGK